MRVQNVLLFLFLVSFALGFEGEFMGKLKAGFQLAGKFLGLDESHLAQMVSQTFGVKTSKKPSHDNNIFSGFLRLLGLDSKKLSAIAINAIIFIAQLISSGLSKTPQKVTEEAKMGTPLDWMLNNSHVERMLGDLKDADLPNDVVEYIKERGLDEDTGCLQLLVCKTAPFVWSMQKTIQNPKEGPKGYEALFAHLPSMDEFAENGDACEKKHRYCLIHY